MKSLVIVLLVLVVLDILLRLWQRRGPTERQEVLQRETAQRSDWVAGARAMLDTLDLKSDQLARLASSPELGWRFSDYILDHGALDETVLESLARMMPAHDLGKILVHSKVSQEAKKVAQERLAEDAAREAASLSDSESSPSSDDGYECDVGGPSCCGRGQGPYYH